MMKEKSVATADKPRDRSVSDDRGKRTTWCTREEINFGPKPTPLCSPRDVFDYLEKNGIQMLHDIMMDWCPLKTDVMMAPLHGGVFIHP